MATERYLALKQPPAPMCTVTVRFGGKSVEVLALIDSGADATTIPKRVYDELAPPQYSAAIVFGATTKKKEDERERPIYAVEVEFMGIRQAIFAVYLPERPYMLIGRDILNHHELLLDGPQLQFTIE